MSKFFEFIKKYDILILIILGVLFYFPSLSYDFVSDDLGMIKNKYLNGNTPIAFIDFFKPNFITKSIYNPITFIVYWLIIKIFSLNTFVFHFLNIFFYISSFIVLFYLLKKIINNYFVVFFAVVLYILHPCHIECVAWIGAMGYNIASLFFFLSFLYFIIAFDENKKLNYIYSVIFYILAILSQPIAVTLPAILVLWVYCFRRERVKESIKYICAYIPFLLIYLYLYKQTVLTIDRFISVHYNYLQKFCILGFDFLNSFLIIKLSPIQTIPNAFFILSFICFLILCIYFRKNKYIIFFLIYEVITIFPYSNIVFDITVPIAERYLLLSSVSSCVLLSYLSFYFCEKFREKILLKYIIYIFVTVLYLFSFCYYLPVWANNNKLWTYTYNMNPTNLTSSSAYFSVLYDEGKYDESLSIANKIIKNEPNLLVGYKFKIKSLIAKKEFREAKKTGVQLLKLFPDNYDVYLLLFDIFILLKDYDEALIVLDKAENIIKNNYLYKYDIILFTNKRIILSYVKADAKKFIENLKILTKNFTLLQDNGNFSKILEKKDYKSKEEICLNYLQKFKSEQSQNIILLLSCLYMQENYKDNAAVIMKNLLEDIDKAESFLKNGDMISAEKIYLDVISKNKYIYIAYKNLGILYLHKNMKNEAKKMFNKMLEIDPNDEQVKQFIMDYCK